MSSPRLIESRFDSIRSKTRSRHATKDSVLGYLISRERILASVSYAKVFQLIRFFDVVLQPGTQHFAAHMSRYYVL